MTEDGDYNCQAFHLWPIGRSSVVFFLVFCFLVCLEYCSTTCESWQCANVRLTYAPFVGGFFFFWEERRDFSWLRNNQCERLLFLWLCEPHTHVWFSGSKVFQYWESRSVVARTRARTFTKIMMMICMCFSLLVAVENLQTDIVCVVLVFSFSKCDHLPCMALDNSVLYNASQSERP